MFHHILLYEFMIFLLFWCYVKYKKVFFAIYPTSYTIRRLSALILITYAGVGWVYDGCRMNHPTPIIHLAHLVVSLTVVVNTMLKARIYVFAFASIRIARCVQTCLPLRPDAQPEEKCYSVKNLRISGEVS